MTSLPTRLRFLSKPLQEPQISNFMFSTALRALRMEDDGYLLPVQSLCEFRVSLASDDYDYGLWNVKPCSLVSMSRNWQ